MVATVTDYTDSRNRAATGQGFDGVVRISVAGYYGTGALLYDGQAILTAAHLVDTASGVSTSATVHFETAAGQISRTATAISVNPAFETVNDNNDLALLWLDTPAPIQAERYTLYRSSDEIGKDFAFAGYGTPGTGSNGEDSNVAGYYRLKAENRFDADTATLKIYLRSEMAWSPESGTQLVADFDNGSANQDALGLLIQQPDRGLGNAEGITTPGDSGGAAFIGGQIAGVASYGASLASATAHPDADDTVNGTYGEVASWQRVSHYQQWIDQSLRARYADAPAKPEDVQKTVAEGNSGTTRTYFMVEFHGEHTDPNVKVQVDYRTRDGAAKAGEDYLAAGGTLVFYPGESHVVIPVEIIGDTLPEPDEIFSLEIYNPVGGSFPDGQLVLTAIRTILGNDGWLG